MTKLATLPEDVALAQAAPESLVVKFGEVFKVANEEQRIIEGYASTNDLDEYNDIIEPTAYAQTLTRYMQYPGVCLNHQYENSIGVCLDARIDARGLWVRLQISAAEPDVWTKIKEGVYRAFSISGRIVKSEYDSERNIRRITDLILYEVSVVWLPANRQARIDVARSMHGAILNGTINRITQEGNMPELNLGGTPGTQPADVAALVDKSVDTKLSALSKKIGDQIESVTEEAAKTAMADALRDENSDLAKGIKLVGSLKEKVDQGATKSELKEMGDKLSSDLLAISRSIQQGMVAPESGVGPGFYRYAIDASDIREVLRKDAVTDAQRADAREFGMSPSIMRLQMIDPMQLSGFAQQQVRDFQRTSQQVALTHIIMSNNKGYNGNIKNLRCYQKMQRQLDDICKGVGMDTATAGEGLEWVPTIMNPELIRRIEIEANVAKLFRRETMPSPSWPWPVIGAGATFYTMAQATSDSMTSLIAASIVASAQVVFTAVKGGVFVPISVETIEDAIFAAMPVITDEIVLAIRRGLDNGIINGDSDGSHQDTDVEAVTAHGNKLINGLRKKALAASGSKIDAGAVGLTAPPLRNLRKKMLGARIENPADCAYILSASDYINLLSDNDVKTVDKFGEQATWLTGVLLALDAIPIVLSDFARTDVNASGVNGASGNTFSTALCVHKPSFAIGDRRQVSVESAKYIYTDQIHMVATWRGDFQNIKTSNYPVTILYNIDPQ